MDAGLKKQLEDCGADVDATVKRFMGNEGLYMKFLGRFPDDKNFGGLVETIPAGQYEDAFRYAHTLKGVAANLGINTVYDLADKIVEVLRNKAPEDVDAARAQELLAQLKEDYGKICAVISANK